MQLYGLKQFVCVEPALMNTVIDLTDQRMRDTVRRWQILEKKRVEQFIFVSAKISLEARETGKCLLTPYTNFTGLNLLRGQKRTRFAW